MNRERGIRWIKGAVIAAMVLAMLWVWPVHPFREVSSVRSGDEGHAESDEIGVGESVVQYFQMPDNNIIQLEYVVACDEARARKGELLFELLTPDGTTLYEEVRDYAQTPDYSFGGPVLNLPVKKGRLYAVRLTNRNIADNPPRIVYTGRKDMQCLKKRKLLQRKAGDGGETEIDGEWLMRVTTNSPISALNVLALWGCIALAGVLSIRIMEEIVLRLTTGSASLTGQPGEAGRDDEQV